MEKAIAFDDEHFARFDLAHELSVDEIERRRLTGDDDRILQSSQDQRSHSMGVADGNEQ